MKSPSYGLCCVLHPQVLTKDSVTVAVDAVVYFRIYNATMSITNVENSNRSTRLLAQTTLRNVLGTKNLSEILGDRETISETMQVNQLSLYLFFNFNPVKGFTLVKEPVIWTLFCSVYFPRFCCVDFFVSIICLRHPWVLLALTLRITTATTTIFYSLLTHLQFHFI